MKRKMLLTLTFIASFSFWAAAQDIPPDILLVPTATIYDIPPVDDELLLNPEEDIDSLRSVVEELELGQTEGYKVFGTVMDIDLPALVDAGFMKPYEIILGNGDKYTVSRLKVRAPDAYSLSVIFDQLELPDDASLFVYNEDMSRVEGPFTATYNAQGGLATTLLAGESITIEFVYKGSQLSSLPFLIEGINYDFRNEVAVLYDQQNITPGNLSACHNNVNCDEGNDWRVIQRATVLIHHFQLKGKGNQKYAVTSSGALVNNTKNDGKPYVLYAQHSYYYAADKHNFSPNKWTFYLNYEKDCKGGSSNLKHIVRGGTHISTSPFSDFALLELSARVPSSFQPYFAGWDRTAASLASGTVIHHPAGNHKMITFDYNTIVQNTGTVQISVNSGGGLSNRTHPPGSLWEVYLDNGTLQGGSSGAPLYNENKRLVGMLSQGVNHSGSCPRPDFIPHNRFGRFATAWDYDNTGGSATRLKDWLDPSNISPTTIAGYAPQGWIHDWLGHWGAHSKERVYPLFSTLDVGTGGQVFYRGWDNKVQAIRWTSGGWQHSWPRGESVPSHEYISGDLVVGEGNQVFYRADDGRIHTYYGNFTSGWTHDWVDPARWNASTWFNVHTAPFSLVVGEGNQLFYRGGDNKMQSYYWTAANGWQHAWIINGAPSSQDITGTIALGNQNHLFYRGLHGKLHTYFWTPGGWQHHIIDNSTNNSTTTNVSDLVASIAVDKTNNTVYYRGNDDKIHSYAKNPSGTWVHGWVSPQFGQNEKNIKGSLHVQPGGEIVYKGQDGKVQMYYKNSSGGWVHTWIEGSWQAPPEHSVTNVIKGSVDGEVIYAGHGNRVQIYYWQPGYAYKGGRERDTVVAQSPTLPVGVVGEQMTKVELYPNPANSVLNLEVFTAAEGQIKWTISDINGRQLNNSQSKLQPGGNVLPLDVSKLSPGVYILSVENSGSVKTNHKFIKM